jgi:hypothetical protein
MGFEVNRFQGEVDEELVCPICSGVLEDPLQVSKMEGILQNSNFCCSVVRTWRVFILRFDGSNWWIIVPSYLKLDMYVGHKRITNLVCASQWLRTLRQFETLRLYPMVGRKNMYYVINFLVMKIIDIKCVKNLTSEILKTCASFINHPWSYIYNTHRYTYIHTCTCTHTHTHTHTGVFLTVLKLQ